MDFIKKATYQYFTLRSMAMDFFADSEYKLKLCLEIYSVKLRLNLNLFIENLHIYPKVKMTQTEIFLINDSLRIFYISCLNTADFIFD